METGKYKVPIKRLVEWLGDSRSKLKNFPDEVKKDVGDELLLLQYGEMPKTAKPLKGIGSGVFELIDNFDKNTYRTVVALQLGKKIYILHAFMKKSKKGITTPKKDIDLIKKRYRDAQEVAKNEKSRDQKN